MLFNVIPCYSTSICYIVGLKMMAGPKTARNGNLLAAGGMTLAIFATIFLYQYEIDNESKDFFDFLCFKKKLIIVGFLRN